jgi:hypothetical protein
LKDSKIQRFKDSKIQRLKDSKIQRFKDSKIERFKDSSSPILIKAVRITYCKPTVSLQKAYRKPLKAYSGLADG